MRYQEFMYYFMYYFSKSTMQYGRSNTHRLYISIKASIQFNWVEFIYLFYIYYSAKSKQTHLKALDIISSRQSYRVKNPSIPLEQALIDNGEEKFLVWAAICLDRLGEQKEWTDNCKQTDKNMIMEKDQQLPGAAN